MKKVKGALIATFLWVGLIMTGDAKAYYITMDIDSSIRSGTVMCKSVKQCWVKVQYLEARGATNYCNSVTIKRDGRVVWFKNYYR